MQHFSLIHVNTRTGVRQNVTVQAESRDGLLRFFTAMATGDTEFGPNGSVHLSTFYGAVSIIPFEDQ